MDAEFSIHDLLQSRANERRTLSDGDARGFSQWSKPAEWVGWDGLLVTPDDDPKTIDDLRGFFDSVELAAEFPMTRGGTPFRTVRVWRCTHQTWPFPFGYGTN